MQIDLSNQNLKERIDSFHSLNRKPSFSISDDVDVHILFVKRRDKYYGIRTAKKAEYKSPSEFLVYSFMIEEVRAHVKENLTLNNLIAEECAIEELGNIFSRAKSIKEYLPELTDVESAQTIVNDSDLNWLFFEDSTNYHSLFWNESESKLFSRYA